jgi:CRP/FNR family cyclic AMP-dependent transcriptional regulator
MKEPHGPPPDVISFLRGVPLFAGLDEGALQALARAGQLCRVPKGKLLFCRSDPAEAFYIVRSGCVAILLDSPDGRELVINEMRSGDGFGELGLITGQPRSTGAMACEASQVLAFSRDDFLALLESQPGLVRRMLETMARRLEVSSELESALAFLEAPARLARLVLQLDRQASAAGYLTIGQEELAQRIGLTRQTVAKELGKWRRAGWLITGRGKIVLLNRAALRRQAEEVGRRIQKLATVVSPK